MKFETECIPSPNNCPMFNENGMCMCTGIACNNVKDYHCTSMRSAYIYGFNTMAQRATERTNMLTDKVVKILQEDGE